MRRLWGNVVLPEERIKDGGSRELRVLARDRSMCWSLGSKLEREEDDRTLTSKYEWSEDDCEVGIVSWKAVRLWLESGSFGEGVMWSMSMIGVGNILEVWITGDREAKKQASLQDGSSVEFSQEENACSEGRPWTTSGAG